VRRPGTPREREATPPAGPGTLAIDHHVDTADGAPAALRWSPRPAHSRSGPAPLAEVTAHRMDEPDHWHLVTYGLSDVDAGAPDPDGDAGEGGPLSGWGFELTLRVEGTDDEPTWAVEMLTNLAAYVRTSGHPFAHGHHIDLRGPIRLGTDTDITAAAIVADPVLGVLDTPAGAVELLQVVGLTAEELELCRAWSTAAVIDLLARGDPLLVTRLQRPSLLDDPATAGEIAAHAAGDGSELTELRVARLSWSRGRFGRGVTVEISSGTAAALGPALRRELVAEGASFPVVGDDVEVRFALALSAGWRVEGAELVVEVAREHVGELSGLFDGRPGWGHLAALPGLRVHVVA